MIYQNHLLAMLSFCLIAGCQLNHEVEKLPDSISDYALFNGAGPTEILSFGNTNLDIEDMVIAFDDVAHRVEVCDRPDYYLCIESPFEIYVPKEVGASNFKNSSGEVLDVVVTTYKDEANKSQVCDLNGFWVSVKNETSKYTGNFHFNSERGLVALFETLRTDDGTYEPVLAYSLNEGSVFEFKNFCKKGPKKL